MCPARWVRCGLLIAAVCSAPATTLAQTREEAVQAARRGEFEASILALRTLLTASPSDTATAFDLAVVLEWAGRPREATDAFERTGVAEPPEYVLGAMVRAYRTERRWAEAGALHTAATSSPQRSQRAGHISLIPQPTAGPDDHGLAPRSLRARA